MSITFLFITVVGCFFGFSVTYLLTHYYGQFAHKYKILDMPNERSSHAKPTARGAGICFFIAFNLVLVCLMATERLSLTYAVPVFIGGPIVLFVGYWDDVMSVRARYRLLSHFIVSLLVVSIVTKGFEKVIAISFLPAWPWLTLIFSILYIAWFINLYNFMDGCDGLAASVGMVGSALIGVLSILSGNYDLASIYFVLAACLMAFLIFNWHPASVFMGDCGAYYLGYMFAAMALVSKLYYDMVLLVHMIIFGAFIVDATWTLIQRLFRRQKVYLPHKDHAFQKLLKAGWKHTQVTTLYLAITVLWLLPMALLATNYPKSSFWILIVSYLPIWVFVVLLKAGCSENRA